MNILVVRLGAMGDVIHALPAVAALRRIPQALITWVIDPRWRPLVEVNPDVDAVLNLNRRDWSSVKACWRHLRSAHFDAAIDFQGLLKSAAVVAAAGARCSVGFDARQVRERPAALFYSKRVLTKSEHVVDKNIELAQAAGATDLRRTFWLPRADPEGPLPARPFVLCCPHAGWRSKQWPLEYYGELAKRLASAGVALVVNGPASARTNLEQIAGARLNLSGMGGLIAATRQASAVVGVDSGPLHLAAALGKPGVAIFGPTDPARNGPYGGTIAVLRSRDATTTYKRGDEIDPSMRSVRPGDVLDALLPQLAAEVAG
jgi:heptosyltransferase-1